MVAINVGLALALTQNCEDYLQLFYNFFIRGFKRIFFRVGRHFIAKKIFGSSKGFYLDKR